MQKMLQPIPKMASMREVQRNYRTLFDWVRKTKKPLVLTSGSAPYVVVLDIEEYHLVMDTINKQQESKRERERRWKKIEERLAYIKKQGRQDMSLSEFIINDRENH